MEDNFPGKISCKSILKKMWNISKTGFITVNGACNLPTFKRIYYVWMHINNEIYISKFNHVKQKNPSSKTYLGYLYIQIGKQEVNCLKNEAYELTCN